MDKYRERRPGPVLACFVGFGALKRVSGRSARLVDGLRSAPVLRVYKEFHAHDDDW